MIIYPSLAVKNPAQQEMQRGIAEQIKRIKTKAGDHGNTVEKGNWPIEVELDARENISNGHLPKDGATPGVESNSYTPIANQIGVPIVV